MIDKLSELIPHTVRAEYYGSVHVSISTNNLLRGLGFLLVMQWCLLPTPARAFDQIPRCATPSGARSVEKLGQLPLPLQSAIRQKYGEIVPRDADFDATDVVWYGHDRRLISIWSRGDLWVIATEHGGRGYNDPVFAYRFKSGDASATFLAERITFPEKVCQVSTDMLNAK
jgi:hypothetical protein